MSRASMLIAATALIAMVTVAGCTGPPSAPQQSETTTATPATTVTSSATGPNPLSEEIFVATTSASVDLSGCAPPNGHLTFTAEGDATGPVTGRGTVTADVVIDDFVVVSINLVLEVRGQPPLIGKVTGVRGAAGGFCFLGEASINAAVDLVLHSDVLGLGQGLTVDANVSAAIGTNSNAAIIVTFA